VVEGDVARIVYFAIVEADFFRGGSSKIILTLVPKRPLSKSNLQFWQKPLRTYSILGRILAKRCLAIDIQRILSCDVTIRFVYCYVRTKAQAGKSSEVAETGEGH
jgi:hypothetical protein